jgi:hypothetical protein
MTAYLVAERFQCSTETISRHFHSVLHALFLLSKQTIRPPSLEVPDQIKLSTKFFPYFEGCIGAMDGTLNPSHPMNFFETKCTYFCCYRCSFPQPPTNVIKVIKVKNKKTLINSS